MSAKGNLVVLLGGGLIAANVALDPTFSDVRSAVVGGNITTGTMKGSPALFVFIGILTLIVMSFIADDDDSAANTMLIALAALWIVWIASYKGQSSTTNSSSTAGTTSTAAQQFSKQGKGKNAQA